MMDTDARPAQRQRLQGLRVGRQARPTIFGKGARALMGRVCSLGALVAATTLLASPSHAEPAWSELQGRVQGTSYGEAGGIAVFVLGCGQGTDPFVQAPLPAGVRPRAGRSTTFYLAVDGKRFAVRGRIVVDDKAEGGPRGAVVAPVHLDDALVKALTTGKRLTLGKGEAKEGELSIPLDGGTALLAKAVTTCGGPAPAKPDSSAKPEAGAKPDSSAKPEAAAPAPQAAEARPAPAQAPAEAAKPGRAGVPAARDIAAAIFVDPAEGQRVADKLKITPVDLNGDGAPEAIITLNDPTWCGDTGCTWFVVDLSGKPRVMGQFIGLGLAPGKDSNDGWRDLSLKTPGGGSERMYYKDGTYH